MKYIITFHRFLKLEFYFKLDNIPGSAVFHTTIIVLIGAQELKPNLSIKEYPI